MDTESQTLPFSDQILVWISLNEVVLHYEVNMVNRIWPRSICRLWILWTHTGTVFNSFTTLQNPNIDSPHSPNFKGNTLCKAYHFQHPIIKFPGCKTTKNPFKQSNSIFYQALWKQPPRGVFLNFAHHKQRCNRCFNIGDIDEFSWEFSVKKMLNL